MMCPMLNSLNSAFVFVIFSSLRINLLSIIRFLMDYVIGCDRFKINCAKSYHRIISEALTRPCGQQPPSYFACERQGEWAPWINIIIIIIIIITKIENDIPSFWPVVIS